MRSLRQIEFCMKWFGRKKNPAFELRIQGFRRMTDIRNLLRKSHGCVIMQCFVHAQRNMDIDAGLNGQRDAETELDEDEICFEMFLQYMFIKQWKELKSYANAKGIHIMGMFRFMLDWILWMCGKTKKTFNSDPQGYPIHRGRCAAGLFQQYRTEMGKSLFMIGRR